MQKTELRISERKVEEFLDLHIKVLTGILQGKGFEQIREEYEGEFERLNYLEVATKYLSCLSFNEKGELKAAYPLSPKKTDYHISVDGIGSGYAMCAVDALGAAYTFKAKTVIESADPATQTPIKITIDPENLETEGYSDIVVTAPKAIPQKKEGETFDASVDMCPQIGFFESAETIPKEQQELVAAISFEEALKHGRSNFDIQILRQGFKEAVLTLMTFYQKGSISEDEFITTYVENTSNSILKSLQLEQLKTIILQPLIAKKVFEEVSPPDSHERHLRLADLGERILKTFLD